MSGGGGGGGGGGKGGGGGGGLGAIGAASGEMMGSFIGNQQAQSGRDEAERLAGEAYNELMGIGLPPDLSKELILKQFQSAGKLTPELEKSINVGISKVSQIQEDPSLKNAQMSALQSLQQRGRAGLSPEDRANLNQIRDENQRDANAKQQQILQQMQQRGMGGSGAELIAELQASQGATNRASQQGDNLAAMASKNALESLTNSGNLAGNIRSQDFNVDNAKAKAEDEFNRFNVQNQIAQQQRNVSSQNQAQASNLQNAQNIANANTSQSNQETQRANNAKQAYWDNIVKRAGIRAGTYTDRSNQFNAQADAEALKWTKGGKAQGALAGNIVSTAMGMPDSSGHDANDGTGMLGMSDAGSTNTGGGGGSYANMASQGAVVPGKANVPGNSPLNDTVHYKLSPGEIVIPRTVAEKSEEEIAKFVALMRPKKGK